MTKITPIFAFQDNIIWMLQPPASTHVWIVDPGTAQPVIDTLKINQFTLAGILLTHHHKDHSGGIADLLAYAGNVPVYSSHKSTIPCVTHRLKNGDVIQCAEKLFEIIEIPGHTLDHIAFHGNSALFCGDTLFSAGCGRVFEGTYPQIYSSLQQLYDLPDDTQIYCGHEYTLANLQFAHTVEPANTFITDKIESVKIQFKNIKCSLPSLLRDEKIMNPFFRCHIPDVIQSAEKHAEKKLNTPLDVFQALREWKNIF